MRLDLCVQDHGLRTRAQSARSGAARIGLPAKVRRACDLDGP